MSIDLIKHPDGIAIITMNRPEKLNAFDAEHYAGLANAWAETRDDKEVRVVIITGAGEKSFSTGADLKSFIGNPPNICEFFQTQKGMLLNRGLEMWKPVVAAVNGYCLAGGMTLLLATDIRIAAEHATFGLSEVKRGIIPANGGTQRIIEQLPRTIAMEMLLTGDAINANKAQHWGLVNQVVSAQDLMNTAYQWAEKIAKNAPLAVQASKELALRARELSLAEGLRMEQLMNRMLSATEDAKEGRLAFSEKREPKFTAN
jgi:E-phenylitaconyl-CoA hydratase